MAHVHDDKCDECDNCGCGRSGFCFCHAMKAVVGIVVFIIVLALAFWLVGGLIGLVTGFGWLAFSGWGWIPQVIVFVFVFCFIIWILRMPFRFIGGGTHSMRILRRRYARGEISEAQFKRMRKNLMDRE